MWGLWSRWKSVFTHFKGTSRAAGLHPRRGDACLVGVLCTVCLANWLIPFWWGSIKKIFTLTIAEKCHLLSFLDCWVVADLKILITLNFHMVYMQCCHLAHLNLHKPAWVDVLLKTPAFRLPFWLFAHLNEVYRVLNVTELDWAGPNIPKQPETVQQICNEYFHLQKLRKSTLLVVISESWA